MSEYLLKPVTTADADIAVMTALLRTVFPKVTRFTEEVVRWQYRGNPEGEVVGFNAWADGELAAHYVTIPVRARVHGTEERGLLSLNTATHPAHQRRGLFTRLAAATYTLGADRKFGFVIGVANANSTHGLIRKLGFQLVSPLRAMTGFGPLRAVPAMQDLAYDPSRSPSFLAWRLAHPAYPYTAASSGNLELLLSRRRQFGLRYVLGAAPTLPVPSSVPREPSPFGKVWIGVDPALRCSGAYVNVPMRLRPKPLNLIFKDLTDRGRTLSTERVRFHALDFDIL